MDAATISYRPHDARYITMQANAFYKLDELEDIAQLYKQLENIWINLTSIDERLLMKQGQPTYFQPASIIHIRKLWT